jgi:uncharacterized Zn finger protein
MGRARRRRTRTYRLLDGFDDFGGFPPYVPVAERRKSAAATAAALKKKGHRVSPVEIQGRLIATTFWGKAWCENLERYSDFSNRLPRGRTYVRNGSVIDLQITAGNVTALVQGSSLYDVSIGMKAVEAARWKAMVKECSGKIDSVVELLSGKLSGSVMEVMTRKGAGLFPAPAQLTMECSCPDSATMCKHVAAVLYGIGARLDHRPELLFELRGVSPEGLITQAVSGGLLGAGKPRAKEKVLQGADLSSVFGIDIEEEEAPAAAGRSPRARAATAPVRASRSAARARKA